jgi:NDP-sugar pyrophosphorylase family protein
VYNVFPMQTVILAAGKGARMAPLTDNCPKPMLKYKSKTLLEHKLDVLPPEVDEVIMVVGYLKEQIMDFFGSEYKGKKITYVIMDTLNGSAAALWLCKDLLKGHFLVLMGDDIYHEDDIKKLTENKWSMFAKHFNKPYRGGIEVDENNNFTFIDEAVSKTDSTLVNLALYSLGTEIFDYEMVKVPGKEEYGLPHTILAAKEKFPVKVFKADYWIQFTTPEDFNN